MTQRCMVTGKGPLVGNKVSHANNKTKRRFMPSVKTTKLFSETLQKMVPVKLSTHGLRSVEHKGGLDAWLLGTAPSRLDVSMRPLRERIKTKMNAVEVKKPAAKKAAVKRVSARAKKAAATKAAK